MGGCVGRQADGGPHSRESSELSGTVGHNKPLKQRRPKWKSDVRLTEAQLQAKRDEFWDTAPAFEGRKEIWDALKACTVALDSGDLPLAQAILDGANITLPNGTLLECYDELGTRYQLPVYVLSPPINLLREGQQCGGISSTSTDPSVSQDDLTPQGQGVEVPIRVHLSTGRDCKLVINSMDSILSIKKKVQALEGVEPARQRIFFSGRLLGDKLRVEDAKISKGYTLQVVVSQPPQTGSDSTTVIKHGRKSSKENLLAGGDVIDIKHESVVTKTSDKTVEHISVHDIISDDFTCKTVTSEGGALSEGGSSIDAVPVFHGIMSNGESNTSALVHTQRVPAAGTLIS